MENALKRQGGEGRSRVLRGWRSGKYLIYWNRMGQDKGVIVLAGKEK